ncbi:unnamed protein product [Closterium sp. NIES-64]|nr:unnamed protein product [Closterium sp. NIES-64]
MGAPEGDDGNDVAYQPADVADDVGEIKETEGGDLAAKDDDKSKKDRERRKSRDKDRDKDREKGRDKGRDKDRGDKEKERSERHKERKVKEKSKEKEEEKKREKKDEDKGNGLAEEERVRRAREERERDAMERSPSPGEKARRRREERERDSLERSGSEGEGDGRRGGAFGGGREGEEVGTRGGWGRGGGGLEGGASGDAGGGYYGSSGAYGGGGAVSAAGGDVDMSAADASLSGYGDASAGAAGGGAPSVVPPMPPLPPPPPPPIDPEAEMRMMQMMGIPMDFNTTKGKEVKGANQLSAVKLSTKRQPRQYMNRRGGFNRPLPAELSSAALRIPERSVYGGSFATFSGLSAEKTFTARMTVSVQGQTSHSALLVEAREATRREKVKNRHMRIRKKLSGTTERPRLAVFRSNNHIYAQVVDDTKQHTLAAASTLTPAIREELKLTSGPTVEASRRVGQEIAKICLERGISKVAFDRGGFVYHGRIQALADGAREGGLEF